MTGSELVPYREVITPVLPRHRRELGARALHDGFELMEVGPTRTDDIRRYLQSHVIGQDDAVEAIIAALDRQHVRMWDDHKPIATLAFLGPTGVGKSEMAKALASCVSEGDGPNIIKIDCSDFSHGHEITRLTGSPPSYVGHEIEPMLNNNDVDRPGTVVLFDEIEKGSEQLYHLMLQIMEDGKLRLGNGTETSFRNATIILTSNLGAKEMSSQLSETRLGFGNQARDTSREKVEDVALRGFRAHFSPEFVNRLDKMVVFHPLESEQLEQVLSVKLERMNSDYERYRGVRIELSTLTQQFLVQKALLEPQYGARSLVRALQDDIQAEFGRHLAGDGVPEGTLVRVFHADEVPQYYGDSKLVFGSRPDSTISRPSDHGSEYTEMCALSGGSEQTEAIS